VEVVGKRASSLKQIMDRSSFTRQTVYNHLKRLAAIISLSIQLMELSSYRTWA